MLKKISTHIVAFVMATVVLCCNSGDRLEVTDNIRLSTTMLAVSVVADSLNVPWGLLWGPDDKLWFNEQNGSIYELDTQKGKKLTIENSGCLA